MKSNKGAICILILSVLAQTYYFCDRSGGSFVIFFGIECYENQSLPYLEILVLCMPIFVFLVNISYIYSFWVEEYGIILLIRNKKINYQVNRIFKNIFKDCMIFLTIIICINIILLPIAKQEYSFILIIKACVIYVSIIFTIAAMEIFMTIKVDINVAQLIITIYLIVSCFANYFFDCRLVQNVFFPGRLLRIRQLVESDSLLQYGILEIGTLVIISVLIYMATKSFMKRKDFI